MFCKHKWKLMDKTILPSGYEQLDAATSLKGNSLVLLRKKVVVILVCTECGKLNKTIEVNP